MITKKIFYTLLIAVFFLSSCQKDIDLFVPDPGQATAPDSTWYNTITNTLPVITLKNKLLLERQKDSLILNNSTVTLTTASGMKCTFVPGSLLNENNLPVTGKIYLETHLLKKKADMIRIVFDQITKIFV